MRRTTLIAAVLCSCAAGTPAGAQAQEGYAPFEVTRSAARRGHPIAKLDVAGAPVFLKAYGRKARARQFDSFRELHEARAMKQVFDGAPQPALVTFEARVPF